MIGRHHDRGVIEAANRHPDFASIRRRHKRQWGPTVPAKLPEASRPMDFPRIPGGESEIGSLKRSPSHERGTAAATTVSAMTVGDVVWGSAGFITNVATKAAALDGSWVHGGEDSSFFVLRSSFFVLRAPCLAERVRHGRHSMPNPRPRNTEHKNQEPRTKNQEPRTKSRELNRRHIRSGHRRIAR